MFNFFKKKKPETQEQSSDFEIELTASVLAYEIARSDGEIDDNELEVLMEEIKVISKKVNKDEAIINWNLPSINIFNKVRAFDPFPSTYTFLSGV